MKKKVILLIPLIVGSIYYFYSKQIANNKIIFNANTDTTNELKISIPKSAIKAKLNVLLKFKNSLSPKIQESHYLEFIQDFKLNKSDVEKNIENINAYNKYLDTLLLETITCLKKDFCGMTPDEDDGYFDPTQTVAHKTIKRVLQLGAPKKSQFSDSALYELLSNENAEIAKLSLEHLLNKNSIYSTDDILKRLGSTTGESRALGISTMLKLASKDSREDILAEMLKGISELPPHSTISLLETIQGQTFSFEELKSITLELCPKREIQGNTHNWKAIKFNMNNLLKTKNSTVSDICQ